MLKHKRSVSKANSAKSQPGLCIIVALPAEAKPLVRHFKLQRSVTADIAPGQECYLHPQQNISLIVSGVGKVAAALAVQAGLLRQPQPASTTIFNLGVAGHMASPLGSLHRVLQVSDAVTKTNYYPGGPGFSHFNVARLVTREVYIPDYPDNALVDMEASGIMQATDCFIAREQVEIFKIVSDNQQRSLGQTPGLSAKAVSAFINQHLQDIASIADQLYQLSALESKIYNQYHVPIDTFMQNYHITHYQQHQLQHKLRRAMALCGEDIYAELQAEQFSSTQALFAALEARIAGACHDT